MKKGGLFAITLLVALALPLIGSAIPGSSAPVTITSNIKAVVDILADLLFFLAAIFIVVAAYNFLMAKGDASKIEQAREQIVYALIAMAIAALAWALTQWLRGRLST